jgi:hypothetical protein
LYAPVTLKGIIMRILSLFGLLGASLFSTLASAQEPTSAPTKEPEAPRLSVGFESALQAFYLWRGIPLSNLGNNQPYAWIDIKGLELGVYANEVLNPKDGTFGSFDEFGLVLVYPIEVGPLYLEPQIQAYFYPDFEEDGPPTAEAYLKVAYPLGPVTPFVTPIVDFISNFGGAFLEAGVEHESEPWTGASLSSSVRVGIGSAKFNNFNVEDELVGGVLDKATLSVVTASLALEFPVWKSLYLRPHVEAAAILNAEVKAELGTGFTPNVGLAIGFAP